MPLSAPAPREHIHTRRIECTGYLRQDGLWDIEGTLEDTKTYAFENRERGAIEPGDPIHGMKVRITVDDAFVIQAVEAVSDKTPFAVCKEVAPNFQRLVGVTIGPGFRGEVKRRVGGVEGCTHLVELFGPLATTAFQTIYPYRNRQASRDRPEGTATATRRPSLLDTCHAFRSDGAKVKELWPDHWRDPAAAKG
ncbi:MAG: DUF2889 domain-containing protein [Alphaproteobacteria bacterium]